MPQPLIENGTIVRAETHWNPLVEQANDTEADLATETADRTADIAAIVGEVIADGGISDLPAFKVEVDAFMAAPGDATATNTEPESRYTPSDMRAAVGSRLTIPTHVSPAGGQTTHPSVLFFPDGWNGRKYWMVHTPYPGGNDDHEDPNIAVSDDGTVWVVPAGLVNPIDDQPGTPVYNSDVDLKLGPGNELYLFWRTYDQNDTGAEERLYYSHSADGTTWAPKVNYYTSNQTVRRLLSPSLLWEEDHWVMWAVDIVPTPNGVVRLDGTGFTPESGWTAPVSSSMGAMQAGKEPWHLFVMRDSGTYAALLTDCTTGTNGSGGDILYVRSSDGISWQNSVGPVIPRAQAGEHDNLYRATMITSYENGMRGFRVWYSAYLAGAPNVWNVYRTFMRSRRFLGKLVPQAGTVAVPIVNVGATSTIAVVFPEAFPAAPAVWVTPGSTRLNTAAINVTATGFDAQFTNFTTANASATTGRWGAVEI